VHILWQNEIVWASLKALAISLVLTPIIRDIFRSYNVVDRPGPRKVHGHPIPRVGGIPIAIAYGFSLISFSDLSGGFGALAWKLIPGAAVIFLTGLADDFFTLKPTYKLVGQIAAALLVYWSGLRIEILGSSLPGWLNLPLTVFWLLLATNALNLIDGLDGLCAGIGLVATLALFGGALLHGNLPLAHATLPLAGALLGFLIYNINPATVFLGDSGALLIGFLLGCYGMVWTQKTATLLSLMVPLLAISIPLLDVFLAVVRRFLRKQPIFGSDRAHIHHRLLDRGLTPRSVVLLLYLLAAGAAGIALLLSAPQIAHYQNILIVVGVGALLVGARHLGDKEFRLAGRWLSGQQLQHLQEQQQLEQFEKELAKAGTEEQWWKAVVDSARDSGWRRLTWNAPWGSKTETLREGETTWTFQISLGESGTVAVEGATGADAQADLTAFAEILRRTRDVKRPHGEQLAIR
jgi:UDP-GlcNAc:undecaprenyl-phosphate/decaprenyl-phosphate GlcNAc-1-phosphate transferase